MSKGRTPKPLEPGRLRYEIAFIPKDPNLRAMIEARCAVTGRSMAHEIELALERSFWEEEQRTWR